jgi:2-oxoglutarate dehydrogenase E2 component (dihydrolipoamide succinyltransferase)
MKVEIIMPQMGESIAEATIIKWLKQPGEAVDKDETIVEISTDKVDSEIPAPAGGTLKAAYYPVDSVVPVKTVIGEIETEKTASQPHAKAPFSRVLDAPFHEGETAWPPAEHGACRPQAAAAAQDWNRPHRDPSPAERFYSPLVKSLAAKHGIPLSELEQLSGSGQGGRLTKQDLLDYLHSRRAPAASPTHGHTPAPLPVISHAAHDCRTHAALASNQRARLLGA